MKASFVTGLFVVLVGAGIALAQVSGSASGSGSASTGGSASGSASGSAQGSGAQGASASGFGSGSGGAYNLVKGTTFLVAWEPVAAETSAKTVVEAHEKYIRETAFRGGIMMEGFHPDGSGRTAVVSGSREAAEKVAAGSPLVTMGVATWKVRQWEVTHSFLYAPSQSGR